MESISDKSSVGEIDLLCSRCLKLQPMFRLSRAHIPILAS
jgi:hypothetical protein